MNGLGNLLIRGEVRDVGFGGYILHCLSLGSL